MLFIGLVGQCQCCKGRYVMRDILWLGLWYFVNPIWLKPLSDDVINFQYFLTIYFLCNNFKTLTCSCWICCRSLGVHVSKVRSVTLDAWEVDLIRLMTELGNSVVNQIYEAKVDESIAARPNASSKRLVLC